MKIAIAITTFNRPEILYKSLEQHLKYLPKGAQLFIVDDGSDEKPDHDRLNGILQKHKIINAPIMHTFPQNKGIAAAKNKCLELADEWGADQIFLFDSDCWPRKKGWELPYIKSKEPHLMYVFEKFAEDGPNGHNLTDCTEIYRDSEIRAFNHVRGCMLYIDKVVLQHVGGFDTRYGKAMFEHTDWSNRIHNVGLTSFRVMDVVDSQSLIYSMDEHREVKSSISPVERKNGLQVNRTRHQLSLSSKEFCRFKTGLTGSRDIVITNYYTSTADFQRGNEQWQADLESIQPLKESVEKRGAEFVLLHDCFDLPNKVECTMDPYYNRMLRTYEYLRDNHDVRRVFMVDATDVTMLNLPFYEMEEGKIYSGDEPALLGCKWIRDRGWLDPFRQFIMQNINLRLLNAGIIGGSREDVMMVLHDILTVYADSKMKVNDMVAFNYVLRTQYADRIVHGTGLVNNRFKSFEPTPEGREWFMHK